MSNVFLVVGTFLVAWLLFFVIRRHRRHRAFPVGLPEKERNPVESPRGRKARRQYRRYHRSGLVVNTVPGRPRRGDMHTPGHKDCPVCKNDMNKQIKGSDE